MTDLEKKIDYAFKKNETLSLIRKANEEAIHELAAACRAEKERGDKAETENKLLRKLLWLQHGDGLCCLYPDDGEMQCNTCIIDFLRDPAEKIETRFRTIAENRLGIILPPA